MWSICSVMYAVIARPAVLPPKGCDRGACATRASLDGCWLGLAPALASRSASRSGRDRTPGPSSTSISRHASSRWSAEARTTSSSTSAHSRWRSRVGDPVALANRADRRDVDQRLAQPQSGEHVDDLFGRRIRQRGADLDASLGVGDLQLPAGVVVAVTPPQQHPMCLQVAVCGVVVRAVQMDGAPLHVGARHDVVEPRQRELLVDLPLHFAFEHFFHAERLSEIHAGETSRQGRIGR